MFKNPNNVSSVWKYLLGNFPSELPLPKGHVISQAEQHDPRLYSRMWLTGIFFLCDLCIFTCACVCAGADEIMGHRLSCMTSSLFLSTILAWYVCMEMHVEARAGQRTIFFLPCFLKTGSLLEPETHCFVLIWHLRTLGISLFIPYLTPTRIIDTCSPPQLFM